MIFYMENSLDSFIDQKTGKYDFEGQKDLETVTGLIQKRVAIYVSEKQ